MPWRLHQTSLQNRFHGETGVLKQGGERLGGKGLITEMKHAIGAFEDLRNQAVCINRSGDMRRTELLIERETFTGASEFGNFDHQWPASDQRLASGGQEASSRILRGCCCERIALTKTSEQAECFAKGPTPNRVGCLELVGSHGHKRRSDVSCLCSPLRVSDHRCRRVHPNHVETTSSELDAVPAKAATQIEDRPAKNADESFYLRELRGGPFLGE